MNIAELIAVLSRLPKDTEVEYLDHDYHGDMYVEPIQERAVVIKGLFSSGAGVREGTLQPVRP